MAALSPSRARGYQFGNPGSHREAQQKLAALRKYAGCKLATIGGDQETSFEQAFASLAYTYIKDRAPRLLDYLVGFQLVDRNEDNTKAVGIFGFRIGQNWVYAPVFFMNGELKGHELLYLKEKDRFVPLKEDSVNKIITSKPNVLGKPRPESLHQLGVMQPDIRGLSIPPHNLKYGSAINWREWAKGFAGIYGALTYDHGVAALQKHADWNTSDVLRRVLASHVDLCKLAMDICERYPAIGDAWHQFHGTTVFEQALGDLRARQEVLAREKAAAAPKALGTPKQAMQPVRPTVLGSPGAMEPVKLAAGPPIEIHVDEDEAITQNVPPLTDTERERLLRDGHLIRDRRKGEEVSIAYNTQVRVELINPDDGGLYEVIQKPGTFVRCLVIQNPHSGDGRKEFLTVVRMSPRNWINAYTTSIFAKPNTGTREEFQKWLEGQDGSKDLKTGNVYVAVAPTGEGTVPFTIEEALGDGRYRVIFRDYASSRIQALPGSERPRYRDWDTPQCCPSFYPHLVYLNDREGTSFRSDAGTLFIPKDAKILHVEQDAMTKAENKQRKKDPDSVAPMAAGDAFSSEDFDFVPGSLVDLQTQIIQKTASLRLYGNGGEVSINGAGWMPKRSALFTLVARHGFREEDAQEMLKAADVAHVKGQAAVFRVKYAGPYDETVGPGPTAPPIPPPVYGYESSYGQVPAQYMETYFNQVPEMNAERNDPEVYNPLPEATPDPMVMQDAQRAGQMGQKEVFDTAMITGLLRAVRQDSLVERYMGDLVRALDRLGRLLFLFYWHNDEFANRFGKSDLPELEDLLRNTFEQLGDLTAYLQEKNLQTFDITAHGGEPDIAESSNG